MAAIRVANPAIDPKKKYMLLEEEHGEDKYGLEGSELVEVSPGHWVAVRADMAKHA